MKGSTKAGPRERLLQAARDLTYIHGVGIGVDAILRESGVARRSLYQHFGGKDNLVAEMLRIAAEEDYRLYVAALDRGGADPRQRLLALFEGLDRTTSAAGFRGCRFTSANLTLVDPHHPAHAVVRAHKEQIRGLLEAELRSLRHPDPAAAAEQLHLLIEGALVTGATRPGSRPGRVALALLEQLI